MHPRAKFNGVSGVSGFLASVACFAGLMGLHAVATHARTEVKKSRRQGCTVTRSGHEIDLKTRLFYDPTDWVANAPVILQDGSIVIDAASNVHIVSQQGALKRRFHQGAWMGGKPSRLSDDTVALPSANGVIDLVTPTATRSFKMPAPSRAFSPSIVKNQAGELVVGDADGVTFVDPNGTKVRGSAVTDRVRSIVQADGGNLFVSLGNRIEVLSDQGLRRTTFAATGELSAPVLLKSGQLAVADQQGTLYFLDAATGQETSRLEHAFAPSTIMPPSLTVADDGILVVSPRDKDHAISLVDAGAMPAKVIATVPYPGFPGSTGVLKGGLVYFSLHDGTVRVYSTQGVKLGETRLNGAPSEPAQLPDGTLLVGTVYSVAQKDRGQVHAISMRTTEKVTEQSVEIPCDPTAVMPGGTSPAANTGLGVPAF